MLVQIMTYVEHEFLDLSEDDIVEMINKDRCFVIARGLIFTINEYIYCKMPALYERYGILFSENEADLKRAVDTMIAAMAP